MSGMSIERMKEVVAGREKKGLKPAAVFRYATSGETTTEVVGYVPGEDIVIHEWYAPAGYDDDDNSVSGLFLNYREGFRRVRKEYPANSFEEALELLLENFDYEQE